MITKEQLERFLADGSLDGVELADGVTIVGENEYGYYELSDGSMARTEAIVGEVANLLARQLLAIMEREE